jgi:hypothetical protein
VASYFLFLMEMRNNLGLYPTQSPSDSRTRRFNTDVTKPAVTYNPDSVPFT